MHAAHAVARVQKAVQHFKTDAVLLQCVDSLPHRLRVSRHQMRRGVAMGFGLNVFGKQLRRVFNAQRLLQARAGCRNEARGQGRRAGGHGIALEQHAVNAGIAQTNRCGQTAGTGTHHDHRHLRCVGRHAVCAHDARSRVVR